jgi:hypothetical protein
LPEPTAPASPKRLPVTPTACQARYRQFSHFGTNNASKLGIGANRDTPSTLRTYYEEKPLARLLNAFKWFLVQLVDRDQFVFFQMKNSRAA